MILKRLRHKTKCQIKFNSVHRLLLWLSIQKKKITSKYQIPKSVTAEGFSPCFFM